VPFLSHDQGSRLGADFVVYDCHTTLDGRSSQRLPGPNCPELFCIAMIVNRFSSLLSPLKHRPLKSFQSADTALQMIMCVSVSTSSKPIEDHEHCDESELTPRPHNPLSSACSYGLPFSLLCASMAVIGSEQVV
jgi:hypothetical protein